MKIQKIVLSSFLITLLVGCEKKPVVENKISEESTTVCKPIYQTILQAKNLKSCV